MWAVDDQAKINWEAFAKDIPVLAYEEKSNIPNYEQRDPKPKYQLPLSPEDSKKLMQVPPGFKVELFASEPDIINPIAMNWDEKGRLWVIETVDYPNTVRNDKGLGDDRIKICEDTNGDGRADKFTIFAENLNIPTSFTFVNGGIIVSQAPQFLFLKDTDGDDVADIRESVIEGWGVYDTHAGPSNLQRGIDNKIYGVVGYSGFQGELFGKTEKFGQGIYRFDQDYSSFEFLTRTSNNTWGLGITEDNSIFASTANNTHSVFMAIPDVHFDGIEELKARGSQKIDGHYNMLAISPNVRQVDVFGGFTAAAGHHFYTGRSFPKQYWNKAAFVCEPTGGVVHIANIVEDGSGYKEKDGGNLIASSDEWFSPVEAKTGPDGSVWILDWYNFIIQHNPTPRIERGGFDAQNGDGNAYVNPLRDKSNGRIWRITPKNQRESELPEIDTKNGKSLVNLLSNSNMFWRMTAQRILVENEDLSVVDQLHKLVKNTSVDDMGMNHGALHALWSLEGLGAVQSDDETREIVTSALKHPTASIRKAAIQILPKLKATDLAILDAGLLNDKDPKVQLAAILYFSGREAYLVDSPEKLGKKFYDLSKDDAISSDPWLATGTYLAAVKHRGGFIDAFMADNPNFEKLEDDLQEFEKSDFEDSEWDAMKLPQFIESAGLNIDGKIWFRKSIELENFNNSGSAIISLGPIDDSDIVYINGIKVGSTEKNYSVDRNYSFSSNKLKVGTNVIAVLVDDTGGGGGIWGKPEQMFLKLGSTKIDLAGDWKYFVAENYSGSSNIFEQTSISELLIENYWQKTTTEETEIKDNGDDIRVVNIRTVKNEMKYDLTKFSVRAGETIELRLENLDFMQHNLIIISPGSLEKVGAAADQLAKNPKGAEKFYIPDMPEVLFSTELVNPQETVVKRFKIPDEPGIYPFICTFPGHWQIMQGQMEVLKSQNI